MFSAEANGLKPHGITLAIHIPGTFLALPTATKKSPKNRVTSRVKAQQQRQRERRQTKSLMSRTIVARKRY